VTVKTDRAIPYELDGGARSKVRRLDVSIEPRAVKVCVPERGQRY
jgi:diacylglycerol kinase family enzyme